MKLFNNCSMIQVNKIPWDINGNNIYKKVSDKDFWVDVHDGGNCVQVVERGSKEKGNLANVWDPIYVLTSNVVS